MAYKYIAYTGKNGGALKSLASASKNYLSDQEDEEKQKEKDDAIKAQQTAATQKAKDTAPWYEKVGGFLGDTGKNIGNFVHDSVKGVYDDANNAITGIGNVAQGQIAVNNQSDIEKQRKSVVDNTNQQLQKELGSDYDNPNSPKWNDPKVQDIINKGNQALGQFNEKNRPQEAVNKSQEKTSQDVDAAKTAAGAASTFLNVATLGTGTGFKTLGEQGVKEGLEFGSQQLAKQTAKQGAKDVIKATLHGAGEGAAFGAGGAAIQAKGNNETADQAATDIIKGAAFGGLVGGAGAGLGKGLKVRAGNKAADAAAAESDNLGKTSAEVGASAPGKQETLTDKFVQSVDPKTGEDVFYRIPKNASKDIIDSIDGNRATPGTDGIAGGGNGNASLHISATTEDKLKAAGFKDGGVYGGGPESTSIDDAASKAAQDLSELDARPLRDTSDDQLNQAVQEFENPDGSGVRSPQDYQDYQAVKDELATRAKQQYQDNGGKSLPEAQKALDDFDAGNVPDSVKKPAELASNAAELLIHDHVPLEMKQAAQEVVTDRSHVEDQMMNLMSPKNKEVQVARLDDQYGRELNDIKKKFTSIAPNKAGDGQVSNSGQRLDSDYKTDIRYITAKEKLDSEYKDSMAELDLLEAQDKPQVDQLQGISDKLDAREQQIVRDHNAMIQAAPDQFQTIDAPEYQATRQALVDDVENAKQFGDNQAEVTRVAESADPVKTYNQSPEAQGAMKTEVSNEMTEIPSGFKNVSGITIAAMRMMSPSQVLRKMGLRGDAGTDLHTPIIKAESAMNRENQADSKVLSEINKTINQDPAVQKQIVEYLEGTRKTLSGVGNTQTADMIRSWLDTKKSMMEQAGYATLDDYFPHIFDGMNKQSVSQFADKVTGKINFGNFKARVANAQGYSTDVMNVLARYAGGINRKLFLEPALKPLDDIRVQLDGDSAEAKWFGSYINQLKGIDNSTLGQGFNSFMDNAFKSAGLTHLVGQDHLAKALGTQRALSAFATMGLNAGSALRNLTQMVNTVAEIGPAKALTGTINGARMLATKAGRDELSRVGVIDGGVSQNFRDAIEAPGVRGRASKVGRTASQGLMSLMRGTDISLRAQAYAGAKALAAAKGLTGEEAENFAVRRVVDTQFMTSRIDMPVAFNSQAVRSLTQLATFSGKQAGFLQRTGMKMIKNPDTGNWHLDVKSAANVLAAAGLAAGMTEVLKPLLGFQESEWVPFYQQIAPFYGAVTGQDTGNNGDGLYRSPIVQLLFGDGGSKTGLYQALTDKKGLGDGLSKFIGDEWSGIVPAGAQIKKTAEGIDTTSTGVSRNANGDIRFLQDQPGGKNQNTILGLNLPPDLQASLFGQYSTKAGQDWIKKGFPTLSDSQTEKVDEQSSREAKQQYATFYQAVKGAPGRQAAYDAVKQAAKDGDANKAGRLAAEYNNKVNDAFTDYWKQYQDMPDDLKKELTGKVLINVGNVIDDVNK